MLTYLGKPLGNREPLDLAEACRRSLPLLLAAMPGQGSLFRVFLPVSKEEVPQLPKTAEAAKMEADGTVLLVEDEEKVRKMAATALKHQGFKVLEARDGVEAVEVFRLHKSEIRCVLQAFGSLFASYSGFWILTPEFCPPE